MNDLKIYSELPPSLRVLRLFRQDNNGRSGNSTTMTSLVHHDLTEHGTEETRPAFDDAPRLDVDVSADQLAGTLDVDLRGEQRVVQSRNEPARPARVVEHLATRRPRRRRRERIVDGRLRVDVDDEFVEVLGVVAVLAGT